MYFRTRLLNKAKYTIISAKAVWENQTSLQRGCYKYPFFLANEHVESSNNDSNAVIGLQNYHSRSGMKIGVQNSRTPETEGPGGTNVVCNSEYACGTVQKIILDLLTTRAIKNFVNCD